MKERETVISVLHDLGRRLWITRAIRETAFGVCVVLFCLVCFKLIEPALASDVPSAGDAIRVALLAMIAAVVVEVASRCVRKVTMGQAAAQADAGAHLRDELKSACWFLSEQPMSPFTLLQVQRAAATAARLDLAALVPRRLPADAMFAAGLALVLAALTWLTPQLSLSWDSGRETEVQARRESTDLRSLLRDAPPHREVAKLDLALSKLQQGGTSPEERMRALADVRDAIDQANMEASAARESLANLADSLKSDPKFEQVARAMDDGRMDDALALMHKLKTDAAGVRDEKTSDPAGKGEVPESASGQAQESAGRDLSGKNAAVNQDAMKRVINALEQANEKIEVQNRVNDIRRRMEDNLIATTQRSQLTASQFDNRSNAPNPTPSPESGNTNVRGGTLFRQAAVAREEGDNAREGSQTGDASGDSPALPLEGAATRRLDAQLKLEAILQKYDAGDEPNGKADPGWFYSASREQKSVLQAESVRTDIGYDREVATDHDRIPVRQKKIVKNYFLNLHESDKK
jgi:hypothetical protein